VEDSEQGAQGALQEEEHILLRRLFPLILSVGFSVVVEGDIAPSSGIVSDYALGLNSLVYFFVVLAAILPASIAAYSIVGEKIEKSLEPLLATPTTDGEILLGKTIAAFVPPFSPSGPRPRSS
jgi:ABC-2 type transport system permease protein